MTFWITIALAQLVSLSVGVAVVVALSTGFGNLVDWLAVLFVLVMFAIGGTTWTH